MSKKLLIVPALVILSLVALLVKNQEFDFNGNRIPISGNIEVREVDVSFKIPGQVVDRLVSEGEKVSEDQQVATLDDIELKQRVILREAEILAAKAALLELVRGYLPEEIAQAEAKLQQADADLKRLEADYTRQKQLYEKKVISDREFDQSQSYYAVAKAKHQEAVEHLSLLRKGVREEKIKQASAKLKVAKQSLALDQTRLGYAQLTTPVSGYVLSENVEAGEFVAAGTPVVTVGNLDDVWLRAYIDETDLGRIKLGQRVEVTTDSYPDKIYEGTITFISPVAEFTPKNVQTKKERVKLVYRVKVNLENPNHELKPGMPADGMILIEDEDTSLSIKTENTEEPGIKEFQF